MSIFWRSGWVDTVPALSVIGMGDADRRDAALRVSRLFKHNTTDAPRVNGAVPAAARDDEQFSSDPAPRIHGSAVSLLSNCSFSWSSDAVRALLVSYRTLAALGLHSFFVQPTGY